MTIQVFHLNYRDEALDGRSSPVNAHKIIMDMTGFEAQRLFALPGRYDHVADVLTQDPSVAVALTNSTIKRPEWSMQPHPALKLMTSPTQMINTFRCGLRSTTIGDVLLSGEQRWSNGGPIYEAYTVTVEGILRLPKMVRHPATFGFNPEKWPRIRV